MLHLYSLNDAVLTRCTPIEAPYEVGLWLSISFGSLVARNKKVFPSIYTSPPQRISTMLFSATLAPNIQRLASDFLLGYNFLSFESASKDLKPKVEHVGQRDNLDHLMHSLLFSRKVFFLSLLRRRGDMTALKMLCTARVYLFSQFAETRVGVNVNTHYLSGLDILMWQIVVLMWLILWTLTFQQMIMTVLIALETLLLCFLTSMSSIGVSNESRYSEDENEIEVPSWLT